MALANRHPAIFLVLLCPLLVFGQSNSDFKPIRGLLVQRGATIQAGVWQATVRTDDNEVIPFIFNSRIVIERNGQLIEPKDLVPGENVEVFLAEASRSALRRAAVIHVSPISASTQAAGAHCGAEGAGPKHPNWFNDLSLYSGVTFAGIIRQCNGSRLSLRTRNGDDRTITLSPNTRYFDNGVAVGPDRLKPNMRVFVRAEKGLLSDLEADQVIWGTILLPR